MAHYNESWDLPPLLGSCYMYGPQRAEEATTDDAWNLMVLKTQRDNLQTALDTVVKIGNSFLMSHQIEYQQQAARLDSCCTLLRQTLKVLNQEISEARGIGKFSYLLDET